MDGCERCNRKLTDSEIALHWPVEVEDPEGESYDDVHDRPPASNCDVCQDLAERS